MKKGYGEVPYSSKLRKKIRIIEYPIGPLDPSEIDPSWPLVLYWHPSVLFLLVEPSHDEKNVIPHQDPKSVPVTNIISTMEYAFQWIKEFLMSEPRMKQQVAVPEFGAITKY